MKERKKTKYENSLEIHIKHLKEVIKIWKKRYLDLKNK